MLRLVLDTNILISALLRENTPPYLLYQAWRESRFDLVTSLLATRRITASNGLS